MKFSEQWLRQWVNPSLDRDALCEQLTMAGLEVDSVEPVASEFSQVVVGEITHCQAHPDADKLKICQVSDGQNQFQIVCGAANARVGLKAPLAHVNAKLTKNGEPFTIKKAKLRAVESWGMLCSASELGLAEQSSGLLELPADAPLGVNVRDYLELDDYSIDLDLTPNRADCLSILGLSRELSALNDIPYQTPAYAPHPVDIDSRLAVTLEAQTACPCYVGRVIENVDITRTTPLWLKERLRRCGIRSIDSVVDITNYVLLELGQPMHAFDFDRLKGQILVRNSHRDEKLTLLDGQTVTLTEGSLVIADESGAQALAGIMGGKHSAVTAQTQHIFLESAYFDPLAIAGKARQYGLHTESSHRFERGVDPQLQQMAIERASQLIVQCCGGQVGPIVAERITEHLPTRMDITLTAGHVNQRLGLDLNVDQISQYLRRLGLAFDQNQTESSWRVKIPSYRFDLAIAEDLIEEIARLYGYNHIPVHRPQSALVMAAKKEAALTMSSIRRFMLARDYQEIISYSFGDRQTQHRLNPHRIPIDLANPLSVDLETMRTSLWGGLLKSLSHNQNRQHTRIRLFETGMRFSQGTINHPEKTFKPEQIPTLAGLVYGDREPLNWANSPHKVDFFDLKGDIEALLAIVNPASISFTASEHSALHPGQSADIVLDQTQVVGHIGALHPEIIRKMNLLGPVFLFELDINCFNQGQLPQFTPLSRFPTTHRDLAIIVPEDCLAQDVVQCMKAHTGENLKNLTLFDVYRGKGIDSNRKSLAIGLTWQHPSRTLTDNEINAIIDNIVGALANEFNATLRE